MKRLFIALFLFMSMVTASFAGTTLVKGISMSSLAIDENVQTFWENTEGKIRIMITDKALYILAEPVTSGGLYTLEKVLLPWIVNGVNATNEKVVGVYYRPDGTVIAIATRGSATNSGYVYFLVKS